MAKTVRKVAKTSEPPDHRTTCEHHVANDERSGLCTATTKSRTLCTYKSNYDNPSSNLHLPTCRTHAGPAYQKRAGRCQADEECGQLCNRLAPYNEPYHLCTKHEHSNSLPSHLMRLPIELRLMIFRHIFPKIITPQQTKNVYTAILKVSRQFHQEASSVLYGEAVFQVTVGMEGINVLGKRWTRRADHTNGQISVDKILHAEGAKLIRKLEIQVTIATLTYVQVGVGSEDLTYEDYGLYQCRDSMRKVVELQRIGTGSPSESPNALKELTIRPTVDLLHDWQPREMITAIFFVLGPLQTFPGVQIVALKRPTTPPSLPKSSAQAQIVAKLSSKKSYKHARDLWQMNVTDPTTGQLECASITVRTTYDKIEALVRLVEGHEARVTIQHGHQVANYIMTTAFYKNFARPLHQARIACEHNDIDTLRKILEAIKIRWVEKQRNQQLSVRDISDAISSLFESGDLSVNPKEEYPDVFPAGEHEPHQKETMALYKWEELGIMDEAPKITDPGVTVEEADWRVHIRKDDRIWLRLKTPAIVRQLRHVKEQKKKIRVLALARLEHV